MADIKKWIEELKNKTLYEAKNINNLPLMILSQTETNARYNERMGRLKISIENVHATFPDGYRELFEGFFDRIVTPYRSLDGWSVEKAIEAQQALAAAEEQDKKKGILGIFGGGSSDG